jgi:dipeptidyl aminopeptidase/acylaminoacyl peptidase
MKPAGFEPGRKYPLLLQMHGGPTAMWGPGESSMWHEFQFFAARGYGIVYANPRGSGGYGSEFLRANYQDWGTGPASDVLAAATEAAKASWVDTSRQVITGGSYAGYLTAWIVAHDHRFKAAFAQRGVYDLTTFMGEANAWRLVPNYFGGYPWQDDIKKVLDQNSPLTYVDQIRTPLLIKHGENDLRTGVSQSEMLYKSLKVLGRDVEYVRMPGATHELSRSGNVRQRMDRILRIYEFMERYIGEQKAAAR